MAMSNNRAYQGPRFQPRGRNADISGMMVKRTPIFAHYQAEKIDNSPFSNYNAKTGESFISDSSQNTVAEEKVNAESIRQLIKEEIAKNQGPEDTNRKLIHTLQAQITDLKQRISEYQKENSQKMQESTVALREEIRIEADKMGKEIEEQITLKLRSFFQKANSELKKDILKCVEDDFLTINYGQDLENRLDNINERINSISSLMDSKKYSSEELQEKIQKASFAENVEPKIAKIQKQLELTKKHHQEVVSRIKPIEEWIEEEGKRRAENEIGDKIESMKEKVKNLDQELQKKVGGLQIQLTGTGGDINILKEKINELQKYNEEQRALFLDLNKKLSGSIQASSQLTTSILLSNPTVADSIKHDSSPQSTFKKVQAKEELVKTIYQVDNEGYLMDGEGKYLLTEEGTMIKLNQEQIETLFDSKVVEIIEP